MTLFAWLRRPGMRRMLIGLACAVVAWLFSRSFVVGNVEEWLQDGCFSFRGPRVPRARVILVGLDEESLKQLQKPLLHVGPELAKAVHFLDQQGAAAVGIDLIIPASYSFLPELQAGGEGDATTLGAAIAQTNRVVLPQWRVQGKWFQTLWQWRAHALARNELTDIGFVDLTEDDDFTLRRQQLILRDGDDAKIQFALALVSHGMDGPWSGKMASCSSLTSVSLWTRRTGCASTLGDGIMVVFGAPLPLADHALLAVKAARAIVRRVHELESTWAGLGCPGFRIGVGIHTGGVVVGTVGSKRRLDWTAIGDTVNTAARIEAYNKETGTEILISGETHRELPSKDWAALRCAAVGHPAKVKGKEGARTVFAVEPGR